MTEWIGEFGSNFPVNFCNEIIEDASTLRLLPSKNYEWIKVQDKFPVHEQDVIFYNKDRDMIFVGRFYLQWGSINYAHFRENLDDWWFEDEEITHWMPLPDPPKN